MNYVYVHYRLDSNEIFYVGISKTNNNKYLRASSKEKRNSHWEAIAKKCGFRYEIVFESNSRDLVCEKEMELIEFYGRKDLGSGPLANKTSGGEKTFSISGESISSGVAIRRKNGTYKRCSEIARERMLTNNPWKGKTHEGFNRREVYQYEASSGNYVGKHKSIRSASREMNFKSCNIISKCLSGKNNTGGGYVWFYKYQGEKIMSVRRCISRDQLKPILELDNNGNVINEWECISDAASFLGVSSSAIGQAIKRGSKVKNRMLVLKKDNL